VIEGFALAGGNVELVVWTRGNTHRFDVDANHIASYIRDVVFCVV
jgi:hypothetical protein